MSMSPIDRPVEPSPGRPRHTDNALESLGKAITDAVREAADAEDDDTRQARHRAQRRADALAEAEAANDPDAPKRPTPQPPAGGR